MNNGYCNDEANNAECNYDGGDCCGACINTEVCTNCTCNVKMVGNGVSNALVGDGICHDELNTETCNFDDGDCIQLDHCGQCESITVTLNNNSLYQSNKEGIYFKLSYFFT